jgi:hypothetical protein
MCDAVWQPDAMDLDDLSTCDEYEGSAPQVTDLTRKRAMCQDTGSLAPSDIKIQKTLHQHPLLVTDYHERVDLAVNKGFQLLPSHTTTVLVSVQPCDGRERRPCDIVCVLDISASMGLEASIKDSRGNTERHGLTMLDVAKHGVKTIINTLGEEDRLSLVVFESAASMVFPLTYMCTSGQRFALQKLEDLSPAGGTNIWQGVEYGLAALHMNAIAGRLGHVMLLTDGRNRSSDSIMQNLQQHKDVYGKLPGTINTFGFGYAIDSDLLVNLAQAGSGSYSFIPDAGFVGTVFVNTLSNLLVTMAHEVYLDLELCSAKIVSVDDCISGGLPIAKQGDRYRVNLGSLQYGQSKDVVIQVSSLYTSSSPCLAAKLQYEPAANPGSVQVQSEGPLVVMLADAKFNGNLVEQHRCRTIFAEALPRVIAAADSDRFDVAKEILQHCIGQVKVSPARNVECVKDLLEDMCGQCIEALSRPQWFSTWGVHFLRSLMFAHRLQQCNNFKDAGVQCYGGKLFCDIRDAADDAFNNLPPPMPSAYQPQNQPVSMATYNNRFSG